MKNLLTYKLFESTLKDIRVEDILNSNELEYMNDILDDTNESIRETVNSILNKLGFKRWITENKNKIEENQEELEKIKELGFKDFVKEMEEETEHKIEKDEDILSELKKYAGFAYEFVMKVLRGLGIALKVRNLKKIFVILAFVVIGVCSVSCDGYVNPKIEKEKKEQEKIKNSKLIIYLTKFINENSAWNDNDIIEKKTDKKFKDDLKIQLKNNILEGFPLELGEINEYKPDKYAAVFSCSDYRFWINHHQNKINFDVIALIDSNQIKNLQENRKYNLSGDFIKILEYGEQHDYINGMVYTYQVNSRIDIIEGGSEINMGMILMKIKDIQFN